MAIALGLLVIGVGSPLRSVKIGALSGCALAVAVTSGVWVAQIPTEAERILAQYFEETQQAEIWVGADPVVYSSSRDLMLQEFRAFDPRSWHGWDEMSEDRSVPLPSVVRDAGVHQGRVILTAGIVNAWNDYGFGEAIVQLIPIDRADAERWREEGVGSDLMAIQPIGQDLWSGMPADGEDSAMVAYCRIALPPFRIPTRGDLWFVKGIVIASGTTLRGDTRLASVGYLACSTSDVVRQNELS